MAEGRGRFYARVALVALVGAALAFLAFRAATVELFWRAAPALAGRVAPSHPAVISGQDLIDLGQANLRVEPRLIERQREALRDAPLIDSPFAIAGGYALQRGDLTQARRLLEEARRRAPRSRSARLYLLEVYLRGRQLDAATGEMSALVRLIPESGRVLVPLLAQSLADPAMADAAREVLNRDPALRHQVAGQLVTANVPAATVVAIGGNAPSTAPEVKQWRAALLARLIAAGDVRGAQAYWSQFNRRALQGGGVRDPEFQDGDALLPFAWRLHASGDGVAEPDRRGGLAIEFYGRGNVVLAEQLLALAPGRYRLSFSAEGAPVNGVEPISWNISCVGRGGQLLTVGLSGIRSAGTSFEREFSVPQGCSGQWLRLSGQAGEFVQTRAATVSNLRIVPL